MKRGFLAVEEVLAQDRVFPPDRIVQRVGAGIAPMAIKVMLRKCGACTGEFEELVGRRNGDFGREDFCLGSDDLRLGDRFSVRILDSPVDGVTGFLKQRLRRMQAQCQIADSLDRVGIIPGVVYAAVYPGAALGAHEGDGLIELGPSAVWRSPRTSHAKGDLPDGLQYYV